MSFPLPLSILASVALSLLLATLFGCGDNVAYSCNGDSDCVTDYQCVVSEEERRVCARSEFGDEISCPRDLRRAPLPAFHMEFGDYHHLCYTAGGVVCRDANGGGCGSCSNRPIPSSFPEDGQPLGCYIRCSSVSDCPDSRYLCEQGACVPPIHQGYYTSCTASLLTAQCT
jgi:hypothetical protein